MHNLPWSNLVVPILMVLLTLFLWKELRRY